MKLNKKGYTLTELLVLLGAVSIVFLIVVVRTSFAFKEIDNSDVIAKQEKRLTNKAAQSYMKQIDDKIKEEKVVYVTGEDIIKSGLLMDDASYKTLKVKYTYDEKKDKINFEVE